MRSSVIKRLFTAKRAGHAGTLDPLASGALPIALGEATKTVPVRDGRPQALPLHGALGRGTRHRRRRRPRHPDQRRRARPRTPIRALLPAYTGTIQQIPPRYSAIKVDGERAYDLARDGETVELAARPVDIARLELIRAPDPDHAVFEAECGKGTYVRALARDIGRALGCFRPCQRPAPGRGRAVRRGNHDFTGRFGGSVP